MLVDPIFTPLDGRLDSILSHVAGGGPPAPVRLALGVYQIKHFSFDHLLAGERLEFDDRYPTFKLAGDDYFGSYGVCDSWEQILARCPEIADSKTRKFAISVTEVNKQTQPEEGGWRWHKWGEYIGVYTPTCEYIHDEPLIEKVYVYHVYELTGRV